MISNVSCLGYSNCARSHPSLDMTSLATPSLILKQMLMIIGVVTLIFLEDKGFAQVESQLSIVFAFPKGRFVRLTF